MMYIIREQKSRCHALPLESIDSELQVTPAPASRQVFSRVFCVKTRVKRRMPIPEGDLEWASLVNPDLQGYIKK